MQNRNDLVENSLAVVGYVVSEMHARYPMIERDELVGAGMEGLVQAADSWDPTAGTKFTTWATLKIKWAIQEMLQGLDWMGRRGRDRANRITKVRNELAQTLGHDPSDAELATALGLTLERLAASYGDTARSLVPIDDHLVGEVITSTEDSPEQRLLSAERDLQLHRAVHALPDRIRQIMLMVYFQGKSQSEVAEALGITDGTVSKDKSVGLAMLQEVLSGALGIRPAEQVTARVPEAKRQTFLKQAHASLAGGIAGRQLAAVS
ncbi:sigma-70 family RNA polymerase sigma factor (plasmid) [Citricoccus nitrophenolicus]